MDLGLAWNHQDWRFFDPQLLRWHSGDPELENGQENWTPYSFGYDNAVRYGDANGREPEGCPTCPTAAQWRDFAAGIGTAILDNNLPTGTRMVEMNATGRDADSYNNGLRLGNGLSLFAATIETFAGLGAAGIGAVATGATGGGASPVSLPVAAGGVALAAHGASTWGKAASNLLNPRATDKNGRINAESSTKGAEKDPWSRNPKSIQDQMTLDAAKKGEGNKIIDNLNDSRFKGMEKWELKSQSELGRKTNVHYVRDPKSGKLQDFKFKTHSTTPETIKRPKSQ